MRIKLVPNGFPCRLGECPYGLFLYGDTVGLKSSYGDLYIAENGDTFSGGMGGDDEKRDDLLVIPLRIVMPKPLPFQIVPVLDVTNPPPPQE